MISLPPGVSSGDCSGYCDEELALFCLLEIHNTSISTWHNEFKSSFLKDVGN